MRWQEEVTLTAYEMQWTIQYFINKSEFWSNIKNIPADDPVSMNVDVMVPIDNSGALAYAKRKHWTWYQLAQKSDKTFRYINTAYKSPF